MKLVAIKIFQNPTEAHIVKGKLESEGIYCFLENENYYTLKPFYKAENDGIRLMIHEEDLERAKALIAEANPDKLICPHCGSDKVQLIPESGLKNLVSILFISLLMLRKRKLTYLCQNCKKTFTITD